MTGWRQLHSRKERLRSLVGKIVVVTFVDDRNSFEKNGILTSSSSSLKLYGFYVGDRHIPLRSLIRHQTRDYEDIEVDINYLSKNSVPRSERD